MLAATRKGRAVTFAIGSFIVRLVAFSLGAIALSCALTQPYAAESRHMIDAAQNK